MERVEGSSRDFAEAHAGARRPARAEPRGPADRSRSSTSTGCAGSSPRCSTRTSSSAPTASGRSRAARSSSRTSSTRTAELRRRYPPAESDTGMFGGNSNWRGPVWFPMNLVIIRALLQLHALYGDRLRVECPTGSGNEMTSARSPWRSPPADRDLHARRATAAGRCSAASSSSRTTRTGATCCCSTSTSTATTAPASAPATRPAGPGTSPCSCCLAAGTLARAGAAAAIGDWQGRQCACRPARTVSTRSTPRSWLERPGRERGRPLASTRSPAAPGTRWPRSRSTRSG